MKLFSLEVQMCYETQDTPRILELKQSIETIKNDDSFGVFAYDQEVMGLIYEVSANKLMSEGKWKLAAEAF